MNSASVASTYVGVTIVEQIWRRKTIHLFLFGGQFHFQARSFQDVDSLLHIRDGFAFRFDPIRDLSSGFRLNLFQGSLGCDSSLKISEKQRAYTAVQVRKLLEGVTSEYGPKIDSLQMRKLLEEYEPKKDSLQMI